MSTNFKSTLRKMFCSSLCAMVWEKMRKAHGKMTTYLLLYETALAVFISVLHGSHHLQRSESEKYLNSCTVCSWTMTLLTSSEQSLRSLKPVPTQISNNFSQHNVGPALLFLIRYLWLFLSGIVTRGEHFFLNRLLKYDECAKSVRL